MTDTELILTHLDSMHQDMRKIHGEVAGLREEMHSEIAKVHDEVTDLREEMHSEIDKVRSEVAQMHVEAADLRGELTGGIEAVRLAVVHLRDRMDTLEFALQTEISKTYDLAQENARKLSRLMCYNGKIVPMPVS